jgi:hypothetical protein
LEDEEEGERAWIWAQAAEVVALITGEGMREGGRKKGNISE